MLGNQFTEATQYYWILGLAQVIHSIEETYAELYLRLNSMIAALHNIFSWFPLIEINSDVFAILNYVMIALILGTIPIVQRRRDWGLLLMWSWAIIELLNGAFHISTWVFIHQYFPGGFSGPAMFVLSILFIFKIREISNPGKDFPQ